MLASVVAASGCTRDKYRTQADHDAYQMIAEANISSDRCATDYSIEADPRSRFYDSYDPDCPPMPLDDPESHRYMRCVNGVKGWKHWYDNGHRGNLENPMWRSKLAEYVDISEDGSVNLDVDSAVRLAYVHSPSNQRQLETLYLSALDVTTERFRLDTQFFGGYDLRYTHNGSLIPPGLTYSPLLKRYIITPAIDVDGAENNRVIAGRPSAGDPALQARRRFATAGELLVGFANSFVFEFTGGDANLAMSLANFSFIQPLLRGAGKDVALEQLTYEERALLANLRAYGQYRQGFYTQVAIGELGVSGPQRGGVDTNLQSFSGAGGVGGYLGLLQQLQQIRNSEDNLNLQLRTRDRLEALFENDLIDLVQVDQFRQSVETERSALLLQRNSLELTLDRYKTSTLGLPPDLGIELDDSMIQQFQLVPREATSVQESIIELQHRLGTLPDDPDAAMVARALDDASQLIEPVRKLFAVGRQDLARMEEVIPGRLETMNDEERKRLQLDRERLHKRSQELNREFEVAAGELDVLRSGLTDDTRRTTSRRLVAWGAEYLQLIERWALIPARARLESVTVESLTMEPEEAFKIALSNRLDFMNGRAALVDRWRLIQVRADALQSVLDVTASGDVRTAKNNPLSFRAPTGNLRLGLEFDAPFTRLLERNAYRESLIEYQRSRRDFIQSRDSLHLGLRALLRNIEQLRQNLEIQRRAVAIAIRRVDQTQLSLNPPRPAPQPGSRPPINPTTAINLLSAQTALRNTQNSLLSAWLNYYAARMRLYRELGIMELDQLGRWIEYPINGPWPDGSDIHANPDAEELPLPPMIPPTPDEFPSGELSPSEPPPALMRQQLGPAPAQPTDVRRLPTALEASRN